MGNLLHMLPFTNPRIAPGTFTRGMASGMGAGALMMGLFYTGMFVAGQIAGLGFLLPLGIGILSTGVFSGLMATKRASDTLNAAHHASREVDVSRTPVRPPEHARAHQVAPDGTVAADPTRPPKHPNEWQQRMAHSQPDRIGAILADGARGDKARASAILAAREAGHASPAETTR